MHSIAVHGIFFVKVIEKNLYYIYNINRKYKGGENLEQKKNNSSWLAIGFFVLIMIVMIVSNISSSTDSSQKTSKLKKYNSNTFNIISSSENKDLEEIVLNYAISKGYTVNIHVIKPKIESKNANGFLKDNSDKTDKKASTDEFILYAEQTISNEIDILEEKKKGVIA